MATFRTRLRTRLGVWGIATAGAVALGAVALGAAALPEPAVAKDRTDGFHRHSVESARIHRGFAISPVRLKYSRHNRDLVGLGSYIVNAEGGCNDCHTNPPYAAGGDPFKGEPTKINKAGYLAGGVAFGPIISANITPHKNRRPNGLTYKEFRSIMRTGHKPGETRIRQVMPWPVFGNMIERDLRAVYSYLRAIPAIRPKGG